MPDSNTETVLLVGQNLFFLGRVEALAGPLGYEVQWATTQSAFREYYASRRPALILVDLEGDESIWTDVLKEIDHQEAGGVKVVAFGPHENVAPYRFVSLQVDQNQSGSANCVVFPEG